jgi:hypothetical protein
MAPFAEDRMRQLYGDIETYRAAFTRAVDTLVDGGWVAAETRPTTLSQVGFRSFEDEFGS